MDPAEPRFKLTAVFEPAPEGGDAWHFEEVREIFSEGETSSIVMRRAGPVPLRQMLNSLIEGSAS